MPIRASALPLAGSNWRRKVLLPEVEPESDFRQVDFEALSPGELWRFYLNLKDGKVRRELIDNRCCEFPSIHPANVGRSYRYLYYRCGSCKDW